MKCAHELFPVFQPISIEANAGVGAGAVHGVGGEVEVAAKEHVSWCVEGGKGVEVSHSLLLLIPRVEIDIDEVEPRLGDGGVKLVSESKGLHPPILILREGKLLDIILGGVPPADQDHGTCMVECIVVVVDEVIGEVNL